MNLLIILAKYFLLFSLMSIGGANVIVPEIHRVFVKSLHLITASQFSNLYALSQAAPGPNVLFVALFGWQIAGFVGAVVSLGSMCTPTFFLALGVEHFGTKHRNKKWYIIIQRAMTPLAIALLSSTGIVLIRNAPNVLPTAVIAIFTAMILLRFRLNPLWLVGMGAILGALGVV